MKKIVRLTESDLMRLVKRVINEQSPNIENYRYAEKLEPCRISLGDKFTPDNQYMTAVEQWSLLVRNGQLTTPVAISSAPLSPDNYPTNPMKLEIGIANERGNKEIGNVIYNKIKNYCTTTYGKLQGGGKLGGGFVIEVEPFKTTQTRQIKTQNQF